jgi:DNA-binding NarL/FixJ family response regulator
MRVLLADDKVQVRSALQLLVEHEPGLHVAGAVAGAEDLLTQMETACPDIVLLDWELPGLQGGALLSALRLLCPEVQIIVLSCRPGARRAALASGADAFASKADPAEGLLAAVGECRRKHKQGRARP